MYSTAVPPWRKPPLHPATRRVPRAPQMPAASQPFPAAELIPLPGSAPEDVVIDPQGRLLVGMAGGVIGRYDPSSRSARVVATTGGRPAGLEALPDGRVLVCDTRRGLLRGDPENGDVETLVRSIRGVPLRFCSNAVAQRDGTIWFTESTNSFDVETYRGAFLEHRPSGRLFRRDVNGTVETVLDGLYFANGVSLTPDESALLFVETANYSLSRLWLSGPRQGHHEEVLDNLPGFPDNMSTFVAGRAWVAMTNPRSTLVDRLGRTPGFLRQLLWRLPDAWLPELTPITWVVAIDPEGQVVADIHDQRADFRMATGAAEHAGSLYLASPTTDRLLRLELGPAPAPRAEAIPET